MWKNVLPLKERSSLVPKLYRLKNAAYEYKLHEGDEKILPDHYVNRAIEFMTRDPLPVHYRPEPGRWKRQQGSGDIIPVQNWGVPLVFPQEANEGLWGGEGIILGMRQKDKKYSSRFPKFWKPYLLKKPLYSEILDQWYSVTVTRRTLMLIDDAFGFDNYILKTHERDLNSRLAMQFRREMLLALVRENYYRDNPEKQKYILKRYERFIIPEEEAEWIGLSVPAALKKAEQEQRRKTPTRPLRELFQEDLLQKLDSGELKLDTEGMGWLRRYKQKVWK